MDTKVSILSLETS